MFPHLKEGQEVYSQLPEFSSVNNNLKGSGSSRLPCDEPGRGLSWTHFGELSSPLYHSGGPPWKRGWVSLVWQLCSPTIAKPVDRIECTMHLWKQRWIVQHFSMAHWVPDLLHHPNMLKVVSEQVAYLTLPTGKKNFFLRLCWLEMCGKDEDDSLLFIRTLVCP